VLTFKQPMVQRQASGRKLHLMGYTRSREEIEVEVAEAGNLTRIFEGLGMSGWFRYEKYRTTFRMPDSKAWASGLLIELDETPIGNFVELEGPAAAIDRAAEELGFSRRDYVLTNYLRFVHGRLPPERRGTRATWSFQTARDPPHSHSNKKIASKSFFLTSRSAQLYQSNCDCNFVINGVISSQCVRAANSNLALVGPAKFEPENGLSTGCPGVVARGASHSASGRVGRVHWRLKVSPFV